MSKHALNPKDSRWREAVQEVTDLADDLIYWKSEGSEEDVEEAVSVFSRAYDLGVVSGFRRVLPVARLGDGKNDNYNYWLDLIARYKADPAGLAAARQVSDTTVGPDRLIVYVLNYDDSNHRLCTEPEEIQMYDEGSTFNLDTTFFWLDNRLTFEIAGDRHSLECRHFPQAWLLDLRNEIFGLAPPDSEVQPRQHKSLRPLPRKPAAALQSSEYCSHIGEEWTACMNLLDDAGRKVHVIADAQRGSIRHHRPKAPFSTEVILLDEERDAGYGVELLLDALEKLDADDKLIWLYVSQLLAPVEPLLQNTFAGGWVDLDDVAIKTLGGYARNPKEKLERRAKVHHAIRMGARTEIIGSRSIRYSDKQTGQQIDTRLHTSPWKIMGREMPEQPTLFAVDTVPLRVELVASREWSALTTHRNTAQYLPFGEIIGAIPGSQPGGAWARALGLAFLDWCRMNLTEALADKPQLWSRQGLLDRHRAKVAPYDQVLAGKNTSDLLKHWRTAEENLRDRGLIEASLSSIVPPMRQGWAPNWKREAPLWKPGHRLRPVLEAMAQNKYAEKPRQLNPVKNKGGRPPKALPSH